MKKTDLKQHVQFDKPGRGGCGLGCCSIGCLGIVGMAILVSVVGYFSLFHSSLPLRVIEAALEEEGEIEIEGLTGTLSTGFSADEIRFKTIDDRWSNLTNVKFKYDSDNSFLGTERLVIEELSVDGGTIYADWDPDQNELDLDPDIGGEIGEELEDLEEELEEMESEFREEMGRSPGFRELRVDLVSVANIKVVNPKTELEIDVDEMKFEGFVWKKGDLESLGELLVHSSQVDLETVPSIEYPGKKNARRFEGTLRAQTDHRLKADVPFVFDFCVEDNLDVSIRAELFGGQLRFLESDQQTTLDYRDFTPGDFIDPKDGSVLPSKINLTLEFDEDKEQGPAEVDPGGSFNLGIAQFSDLQIREREGEKSVLTASADVSDQTVVAVIRIAGPSSPWWKIDLESNAFESADELWAQTLYGDSFDSLTPDQIVSVRATAPKPKVVNRNTGESEKPMAESVDTLEAEAPVLERDTESTSAEKNTPE